MAKRELTYTGQKIPEDGDTNWGDSCLSAPLDTANGEGFFEYFDTLAAHVNDTYTGDVGISTIGYHYQLDSIGSDGVTTKT